MITGTTTNAVIADFKLPEATPRPAPTTANFGDVLAFNPSQYATKDEADALAQLLGGNVNDIANQWQMFKTPPLYQVELPNGMSLNAGLLADRFRRYGTEAALQMTEAELKLAHGSLPLPASVTSSAVPASGTAVPHAPAAATNAIPIFATNPVPAVAANKSAAKSDATPGNASLSRADTKRASSARQSDAL